MSETTYAMTARKMISATPAEVWATWSNPDLYAAIHATDRSDMDFREGGRLAVWFFPDKDVGETFVYHEIDAPRRLVFSWEREETYPVTVTLTPYGDGTLLEIVQECDAKIEWTRNLLMGWAWILDSTEAYFRTGHGLTHAEWTAAGNGYSIAPLAGEKPSAT
jgi:uncharacterized protein YndB with AHSA1/START domain